MLTVLIATRDGADTLPDTLAALRKLSPPEGGWRLVIVDDGSTDDTHAVIEAHGEGLPLLFMRQARSGKNHALNSGLTLAEGDLFVFTDDDVIPDTDWLRELRAAADSRSAFDIFGGPILPLWRSPPPEWVLDWVPLSPTYSVLYPRTDGPYASKGVFGPNMAIRASLFRDAGFRFDGSIGPSGHSYAMGSETDLLLRLEKAGSRAWHCQGAIVHHVVRAHQLSRDWILSRAFRFGRGMYRLQHLTDQPETFSTLGSRRTLGGEIVARSRALDRARRRGDEEEIFKQRWFLRFHTGRALEAAHLHRDTRGRIGPLRAGDVA